MSTIKELKIIYKDKINIIDFDLILANILDKPREYILTHPEQELTPTQLRKAKKNFGLRIIGEPVAYLTGHKEFYGLDFIVNKNVLVPRPETEMMIDETLEFQKTKNIKQKTMVVDVGTGSGCIIITLAKLLQKKCNPSDPFPKGG